jgi:hypothetical protein
LAYGLRVKLGYRLANTGCQLSLDSFKERLKRLTVLANSTVCNLFGSTLVDAFTNVTQLGDTACTCKVREPGDPPIIVCAFVVPVLLAQSLLTA